MKIRYLVSLVFQSLSNKKLVVIILLAMNTISLYMTDIIATDYISQRHYIESITSMFGTHPQKSKLCRISESYESGVYEGKGRRTD